MNTNTFRTTKHVALAAVAALCFTSATVYAGEAANEAPTRTVRYGDLNLGSAAGVGALHHRIRRAAEQVCGDTYSRQIERAVAAKACVAQAIAASEQTVQARLVAMR